MNAASITRLEAVKNKFANEEGYGSWEEFTYIKGYPKDIDEMVDTIAERFAKKENPNSTWPEDPGLSRWRRRLREVSRISKEKPVISPYEIEARIYQAAAEVRDEIQRTLLSEKLKITNEQAVTVIANALAENCCDNSLYSEFQSSLASAYYDEMGPMNDDTYKEFIFKKSNAAAHRFLQAWIEKNSTKNMCRPVTQAQQRRNGDKLLIQLIEILGCKHRSPEESKVLEEAKQYFRDQQNAEGRV